MDKKYSIKEVYQKEEMLASFDCIKELYIDMTLTKYKTMLTKMIPHNYGQLIIKDKEEVIAVSGFWIGHKLWCGKYLELDNVVVKANHRSKGLGDILTKKLEEKGKELECNMLCLDAYTDNFRAGKFYINQGFKPRGFHYIKFI